MIVRLYRDRRVAAWPEPETGSVGRALLGVETRQRGEFFLFETSVAARFEIERTAQFRRVILVGKAQVGLVRVDARLVAQMPEPAVADQHMSDFVAQDHVQNRRRRVIARLLEAGAD